MGTKWDPSEQAPLLPISPTRPPLCPSCLPAWLGRYEGDVSDLGLTFTVTDNVLGKTREVRRLFDGG